MNEFTQFYIDGTGKGFGKCKLKRHELNHHDFWSNPVSLKSNR